MSSFLAAGVSSSNRREPPPYQPPSPGNQLFYLLLTVTASTVVYKSFPKSLRGITTVGVASFGIYHAFGLNCDRIKRVVSNIFGNFPGGGSGSPGGGFIVWERFTQLPWDTTGYVRPDPTYPPPLSSTTHHYQPTHFSPSHPNTTAVNSGARQAKRTGGFDNSSTEETDLPSSHAHRRQPSSVSSPHSNTGGVDGEERQGKRKREK